MPDFSFTSSAILIPSSLGSLISFRRAGTGSRNLHQTLIEAQWLWLQSDPEIQRDGVAAGQCPIAA